MRKITSLILVFAGVIELVTAVVLYIIPSGRVAYWSNYHLMGLDKYQWGDLHITVGFLLVAASLLHICFNLTPILHYLSNNAKKLVVFNKNSIIALLICLYVTVGTLYRLPPMNLVLSLGEHITERGNQKYGEPPFGHAELASLKMFCRRMDLDYETSAKALEAAGISGFNGRSTIAEIADANGKLPKEIYEIIKSGHQQGDDVSKLPSSPMPGFGKMTIQEICKQYGLPLKEVIKTLKASGLDARPEDTVKGLATKSGKNPMAVFEILQDVER